MSAGAQGRESWRRCHENEQGGIVTGWLIQIVVTLAVIGLVLYEILSVVVTNVTLDDSAREVARAARDAYRVERSIDEAAITADEVARTRDVTIVALVEDGDDLVVDLERTAPTLILHRVGPLEDYATATTSSRVRWAP